MPNLTTPTRPLLACFGAAAVLTFAAVPATAAQKSTTKATVAAKKAAKSKSGSKSRADLTITALDVEVGDEGTLLISGNLRNVGSARAGASDVVVALSDDKLFDEDDDVLDELTYSLQPGAKRILDDEIDIPLDVDPDEDLTVLVCADGYGVVAERSERNNCASATVSADDIAPYIDGDSGDDGDEIYDDGSDDDGDW
ncbi:MAG: CARDB domain-containing protein [Patulibacter sp.]